jgi:hypothetical protein
MIRVKGAGGSTGAPLIVIWVGSSAVTGTLAPESAKGLPSTTILPRSDEPPPPASTHNPD